MLMYSLFFPPCLELLSEGVCSEKEFWNGKFAGKEALSPKIT